LFQGRNKSVQKTTQMTAARPPILRQVIDKKACKQHHLEDARGTRV